MNTILLSQQQMKALEQEAQYVRLKVIYLEPGNNEDCFGGGSFKVAEIEKEDERVGDALYLCPANLHKIEPSAFRVGDLPGKLTYNDGKWRFELEEKVAIEHKSVFWAIAYFSAWLYNPDLRP